MANNFQIERSDDSGIRILALDGYLDAHTAPQFENAIHDEMQAGHQRMVVDCSRLTYISSAGLGVFMSFIEELREVGGDIKLAAITPKVLSGLRSARVPRPLRHPRHQTGRRGEVCRDQQKGGLSDAILRTDLFSECPFVH